MCTDVREYGADEGRSDPNVSWASYLLALPGGETAFLFAAIRFRIKLATSFSGDFCASSFCLSSSLCFCSSSSRRSL